MKSYKLFQWRFQDFSEISANPEGCAHRSFDYFSWETAWKWRKMDQEGVYIPDMYAIKFVMMHNSVGNF